MPQYEENQFELYIEEIKQLKLQDESCIITGNAKSFENYKEMCGRIRAYENCLQLSIETLNKMQRS
jgi:hypothetical protein